MRYCYHMQTIKFHGTVAEVKRKAQEWKAANPDVEIVLEQEPTGPVATPAVDAPVWTIEVHYKPRPA